jgi:hypothetical protein
MAMAQEYLKKYGDGLPSIHMKIIKRPDGLLLMRTKLDEWGRKFSQGGQFDYRIFYDNNSYDWISQIEPFGSTVTEAKIMDGGIWVAMPPVEKRQALMAYKGPRLKKKYRKAMAYVHSPEARPARQSSSTPSATYQPPGMYQPPSGAGEGHMYLVMVPAEKDDQFHTLLRFLKLEALKE